MTASDAPRTLVQMIYERVLARGAVWLFELEDIPGFKGSITFCIERNVVVHGDMSREACEAVSLLTSERARLLAMIPMRPPRVMRNQLRANGIRLAERLTPHREPSFLPMMLATFEYAEKEMGPGSFTPYPRGENAR